MITSITQYSCSCNNCSNMEVLNQSDQCLGRVIRTRQDFCEVLRKMGWSIGKIDLCPNCKRSKK